jgi:AcrR family transcriptional regulator
MSSDEWETIDAMEQQREDRGRVRQKRRTRRAILEAASALVAEGKRPSLEDVADAAEVSRRTVYRYFPTQEQLLTEAVLETLRPGMQQALEPATLSDDVVLRLDALVRAMWERAVANESLLRTMIRLTVENPPGSDAGGGMTPRRGYRRIEWIEMALEPLREQMDEERFECLVSALAVCVGTEALIILRDIRGLDVDEAEEVTRWAAQALLQASLTAPL